MGPQLTDENQNVILQITFSAEPLIINVTEIRLIVSEMKHKVGWTLHSHYAFILNN